MTKSEAAPEAVNDVALKKNQRVAEPDTDKKVPLAIVERKNALKRK